MNSAQSNVKRRKPRVVLSRDAMDSGLNQIDDDAAVDTSFFEAEPFDEEENELFSSNSEDRSHSSDKVSRRGNKIDACRSNPTSKRFEDIEVVVLASDQTVHPLDNYQLSSTVLSFSIQQHSKNERVKYSTFVSQKKQLAARAFTCAQR